MSLRKVKIAGAVVALAVLVPGLIQAQPEADDARDTIRMLWVVSVAQALDLTDEKALQVSRLLSDQEKRRVGLAEKRVQLEDQIKSALASGSGDAHLQKLVNQTREVDAEVAMLPEKGMTELAKILSVQEQAKLVLLRLKLNQKLARLARREGQ